MYMNGWKQIHSNLPISRDSYLASKNYREALISQMDYVIIFGIEENIVNILGIFHQLEDYGNKLG